LPRYAYNTVIISVPTGTNRVQFFGANPSRVSLIISGSVFTGARIASQGGNGNAGLWYIVNTQTAVPMTFRDWGPPVQDAIFLSHTSAGAVTLIATEIIKLPGC
jgi:hypothetical protein